MSIGLKRGTVLLEPHQDEWDIEGKRFCTKIKEILGDDIVDVQHVGSTSIRGIYAKPIIDIAVGVRSFQDIMKHNVELSRYGIIYRKREFFQQHLYRCGDFEKDIITHFIHVVLIDSEQWRNYIDFRDYLNTHEEDAKTYEKLKLELWSRFPNDRESYIEGKSSLVTNLLAKAHEWGER